MKVLLVEPGYYTKYPPLGLMKLASYHRSYGNNVTLVRGNNELNFEPDRIEITSLFSYSWKPVHDSIEFYHKKFPDAKIRVGGIYASLIPERIKSFFPFVDVHVGLYEEAERYLASYDILNDVEKWRGWNTSIVFSSRGCLRRCPFCMVPKIEGKIRSMFTDITEHIFNGHKKVVFWDNNFLASPNWKKIIKDLHDLKLIIDFNHGLDARLIDNEKAKLLSDLRIPILRLAYDTLDEKDAINTAVDLLSKYGFNRRNIVIYSLYNFYDNKKSVGDTPETFYQRIKEIAEIGCVSYPMRFEPLNSLKKNEYISSLWESNELEMIAQARRVIGFGGAFPPYEGLVMKFKEAKNFNEAFILRPEKKAYGKTDSIKVGIQPTESPELITVKSE